MLDIAPGFLSHLKLGTRRLGADTAVRMEEAFGTNHAWLLRGEAPVLSDPGKAQQFVTIETPPGKSLPGEPRQENLTFRDRDGRLIVGEVKASQAKHMSHWPSARERFVPLLRRAAEKKPTASAYFTNTYVRTALPVGRHVYSVKAGPEYRPMFADQENLVLERRPPDEWKAKDIHGRICAARMGSKRAGC